MSQRTVAIIQARMGSSRFPGKVLERLGDLPVLTHVIRRVAMAKRVGKVIVATTDLAADEAVATLSHSEGVQCFRGPSDDVLTRFWLAATGSNAEVIVRITADCPLISPGVIDEVVDARLVDKADYASNTLRRTYPHGLDVETFTLEALLTAAERASLPCDREHVTPFIYNNPQHFSLCSHETSTDWSWLRWTVDHPDDLDFLNLMLSRYPEYLQVASNWLGLAERVATNARLLQAESQLRGKTPKPHVGPEAQPRQ